MKRVFIVHGHDLQLRDQARDYISSLGLEPVILSDQPNQGGTIIEKLERDASIADYAVVLLTSDDMGAAQLEPPSERKTPSRIRVQGWRHIHVVVLSRSLPPCRSDEG